MYRLCRERRCTEGVEMYGLRGEWRCTEGREMYGLCRDWRCTVCLERCTEGVEMQKFKNCSHLVCPVPRSLPLMFRPKLTYLYMYDVFPSTCTVLLQQYMKSELLKPVSRVWYFFPCADTIVPDTILVPIQLARYNLCRYRLFPIQLASTVDTICNGSGAMS
jgi:hypothetical protein